MVLTIRGRRKIADFYEAFQFCRALTNAIPACLIIVSGCAVQWIVGQSLTS